MSKWRNKEDFVDWYVNYGEEARKFLQHNTFNSNERRVILDFAHSDVTIHQIYFFNEMVADIAKNPFVDKEMIISVWDRAHYLYVNGYATVSNGINEIVVNKHILDLFEQTEFSDVLAVKEKYIFYCDSLFAKISLCKNISYKLRKLIIEKDPSPYLDNANYLLYHSGTPASLLLELLDEKNAACIQLLKWNDLPNTVFELARIRHNIDEKIPNKWIPSILGWT